MVARAGKIASWLALKPLTGRTHQLRAHCALLGTPIIGDGKYGGARAHPDGAPKGLMLHAREIRLPHPDGGILALTAPLSDPVLGRLPLARLRARPEPAGGAPCGLRAVMSRLIVFDCDGTLVDSQHLIVEAARQTLLAHDLEPLEASAVRAVIGLSLELALAQLVPGVDERMLLSLVATYRATWRLLRTQGVLEPLFPRAREVLGMLDRDGHLLGIATGKSRAGLLEVLDHHGLTALFVSVQTADRHPSKPHPGMLEEAMRETGSASGGDADGRRHQLRHGDGPRGGGARDRRRLGLSSAGAARGGRRGADPRKLRSAAGLRPRRRSMKRFYREVTVDAGRAWSPDPARWPTDAHAGKAGVGRADRARSPKRSRTSGGSRATTIRPDTMPLTRLASTAIDRMPAQRQAAIEEVIAYADTDLVCYRAAEPFELVQRQQHAWQPMLEWLSQTYGVRLAVTTSILPLVQPRRRARAACAAPSRSWATGRWSACTRRPRRSARWSWGSGCCAGGSTPRRRSRPACWTSCTRSSAGAATSRPSGATKPCAATSAAHRVFSRPWITFTALRPRPARTLSENSSAT